MAEKQLKDAIKDFDEKFFTSRLPADDVQHFGDLLGRYVKDVLAARDAGESEEHTKKIINDFLEQAFYNGDSFKVNTSGNIDSSIRYNGKLLALTEVKRVDSKVEMVTRDNLNKKALWEMILYYLDETRNTDGRRVVRNLNT